MSVLNPREVTTIEERRRVEQVLDRPDLLSVVFQPIVDLRTREVHAVEALARFNVSPRRAPDVWFVEAHGCGLGIDLELLAVRRALGSARVLPPHLAVSLNIGPEAMVTSGFKASLDMAAKRPVILELTEHTFVDDYTELIDCLHGLRRNGARLAVDDTGSGYSSLSHLLKLGPDLIKLDHDLTTGIDVDPVRRALAASLVTFAGETGAEIVAEGVETKDELSVLVGLGVHYAQGYYLGRPAAAAALRDLASGARSTI